MLLFFTSPWCLYRTSKGVGGNYWNKVSKVGLIGRSMDLLIIRILNINQIFILSHCIILIVAHQNLNKLLVDYFFLPIYLWMEWCVSLRLGVHLLPKCSAKGTEKYGIPIWDDTTCYPKVHLDHFKGTCLLLLILWWWFL